MAPGPCVGPARDRRRGSRASRLLPAFLIVGCLAQAWFTTKSGSATFTATTVSPNLTFGAAATFPTYPQSAAGDGPWAYHRSDETRSSTATSAAADSSTNSRAGTYNGATNGPVQWWKLNEGSGSTVADSSGSTNPGTFGGGAAWTTNAKTGGQAVSLNGTTSYVAAAGPAVDTTKSFSVAAWVYLSSAGNLSPVAVSQNGTNAYGFDLWYYGKSGYSYWDFSMPQTDSISAPQDYVIAGGVQFNTWTHLVGIFDASINKLNLYVNGSAAGTDLTYASHTSKWNATGPVQIGRDNWNGWNDYWPGAVDDVRIYDRALTAAEVSTVYGGGEASMTAGRPGALQGSQQGQQSSTAVAFGGTAIAFNNTSLSTPAASTVECWFKVTGTAGGTLIGMQSNQTTSNSGTANRVLYLDSGGKLTFAVKPSGMVSVRSTKTYNDGAWHHAAASIGPAGTKLYADGTLVAFAPNTADDILSPQYWRWGGVYLNGFPNRPANDYLTGTLDEVAIYDTQLADQQIAQHYHANH